MGFASWDEKGSLCCCPRNIDRIMSTVAEQRAAGAGGLFAQGEASTSISPSKSTALQGLKGGKRSKSGSPLLTSPHKKASPSDIIFGKPPGTDSASQAYASLYVDSSSSGASTSTTPSVNGGEGGRHASTVTAPLNDESSGSGSASNSSASSDRQQIKNSSRPTTSSTSIRSQSVADPSTSKEQEAKILPALFENADVDDIVELVGKSILLHCKVA